MKIVCIGGGPSGLECARALGNRGYEVTLAEAREVYEQQVSLYADLIARATG